MRRLTAVLAAGLMTLGAVAPAPAADDASQAGKPDAACYLDHLNRGWPRYQCIARASYDRDVCRAIHIDANDAGLPPGFFARLVWQESRFDLNALSPAGAQGIAQFMPATGRLRGLDDAFNPAEALARSADYLRFLNGRFGNLGLAAAAYNAGEARAAALVAGTGGAPAETENYVAIVTGHSLDEWLNGPPASVDYRLARGKSFEAACRELARTRSVPPWEGVPQAPWKPWGVQLAADFSATGARGIFDRLARRYKGVLGGEVPMLVRRHNANFGPRPRFNARVGRDTRAEAAALCHKLQAAGGACVVVKN